MKPKLKVRRCNFGSRVFSVPLYLNVFFTCQTTVVAKSKAQLLSNGFVWWMKSGASSSSPFSLFWHQSQF